MRSISLLVLIAATLVERTPGFSVSTKTARTYYCVSSSPFALQAAPEDSDNQEDQEDKLAQLGYSSRKESDKEQLSVNVNLIPDIDPITVTAIGFALIAFNFFVLGNMGDGGIAGVVARIINLSDSY
jgi:hypothetical protein